MCALKKKKGFEQRARKEQIQRKQKQHHLLVFGSDVDRLPRHVLDARVSHSDRLGDASHVDGAHAGRGEQRGEHEVVARRDVNDLVLLHVDHLFVIQRARENPVVPIT